MPSAQCSTTVNQSKKQGQNLSLVGFDSTGSVSCEKNTRLAA